MGKEARIRSRRCELCGQPEAESFGFHLTKVRIDKGNGKDKFYLCQTHIKALKQWVFDEPAS